MEARNSFHKILPRKFLEPTHIAISRTDSIGDVLLTLPFTAFLRKKFPNAQITFIASEYTHPILKLTNIIDKIITPGELSESLNVTHIVHVFPRKEIAWKAKKIGIPVRIGTSHRLYHWFTCNRKVSFSRKNSDLHESQLNYYLYKGFAPTDFQIPTRSEVQRTIREDIKLTPQTPLAPKFEKLLRKYSRKIIIHPKSQGSAREYPQKNWLKIINLLRKNPRIGIFVTGTNKEAKEVSYLLQSLQGENVHNVMGKFSLSEFVTFLSKADAIAAASTGPLHLGAFLGLRAVGLYVPYKTLSPRRWAPIGEKALAITSREKCQKCELRSGTCACMEAIETTKVVEALLEL